MTVEIKGNMNKTKWHSKVIYLVVALALVLSFSLVTTVPALAAPVVASVTETAFGTDTTDHYVDMPATVNAGDLLIVLFTNDGSATVTIPGGWTQLASNANTAVRCSVYYKIALGDEDGTTVNFITSASEQAAAQVYRITNWHGTTPPEISTAVTGTSTAPDPASLDPAGWDIVDTLWMAVAGQDRGDQTGPTDYPAHYTNGTSTLSSSEGTGSCRTLSACRVLAAASQNPGAFTIPVWEEWVAFTIAVRPASHDLTTSSTVGGSVTTPGEGVFTYDDGTVVDLVATPDAGYRFVKWTGDVGTIAGVYAAAATITMNGDYAITANFVAIYDLTISILSTEGGSVTEPGEGVFTYDDGTVVDLVATPDAGYRFVEWTGDVGTIADVYAANTTITMNGDYAIIANFIGPTITYDPMYAPVYGLIISSTEGGDVTTPGEGLFPCLTGVKVRLVASPDAGYEFVNWSGDVDTIADVYDASTKITIEDWCSITANFETEEIPPVEPPVYPPVYPTVTTQAAATNSTTLHMSYTAGDFSAVQVRFAYKKSADSKWSYTGWVSKSGSGTYAAPLTGLDSITGYDFKAQLKYDDIVIEGITLQFTTDTASAPSPSGSGGCFIATAAYGTPIAEEIEILREFRNKYLLTNPVGQTLVDFYYKVSPPIAEFITEHPVLKPIVRAGLVPAVAMSAVVVNTTLAEKVAMVGLVVLVSVALAVWGTRRRGRGPEYSGG